MEILDFAEFRFHFRISTEKSASFRSILILTFNKRFELTYRGKVSETRFLCALSFFATDGKKKDAVQVISYAG
jgi:hypothetical protein